MNTTPNKTLKDPRCWEQFNEQFIALAKTLDTLDVGYVLLVEYPGTDTFRIKANTVKTGKTPTTSLLIYYLQQIMDIPNSTPKAH